MGVQKQSFPRTLITYLTCKHCHYEWLPRMVKLPKRCPGCKRPNWDKEPTRRWKNHTPKWFSDRTNLKIPK